MVCGWGDVAYEGHASCSLWARTAYVSCACRTWSGECVWTPQFIRDGDLERQIRKSRKIHLAKANELAAAAKEIWKGSCETQIEEAGFRVSLEFESRWSAAELTKKAKEMKIAVIPVEETDGRVKISLSTANVPVQAYREALERIKKI